MQRLRNENSLKRLKEALTIQDVTFRNTDGDTAEVSYSSVGSVRMKYYLFFNGKLINTFIHFIKTAIEDAEQKYLKRSAL